jgi:hypothetical protein
MKRYFIILALSLFCTTLFGQNNVPAGIHYQAVARDNQGKELVNEKISVRFSVLSGDPAGTLVYQEIHAEVTTSKYGVFSLVIGHGVPTVASPVTSLGSVAWQDANHYLKVEVKFENDFMDMGTMQFLAVPYALYAQKSLEPGPQGLKGDKGDKGEPGDPASDNQTLSFDGSNLTISKSNSMVPLTGLLQDLSVAADGTGGYNLSISRGSTINLATVEKDGDPTNEIQDLVMVGNVMKINKNATATPWDLTRFLDNTDNQKLSYDVATRTLGITGDVGTINLTELKNDADFDPTNEIQDLQLNGTKVSLTKKTGATEVDLSAFNTDNQTLSYSDADNKLTITGGNAITLGTTVAVRAGINSTVNLPDATSVIIAFPLVTSPYYIDGGCYNSSSGVFTAPYNGIYTFNVSLNLPSNCSVIINLDAAPYETINIPSSSAGNFRGAITMKLNMNETVTVGLKQTNGYLIPFSLLGTFSGYKVN